MRVKDKMSQKAVNPEALLDSGATASLIHPEVVKEYEIGTIRVQTINIQNIDNSPTRNRKIQEKVQLEVRIGNHQKVIKTYIAPIGQDRMVLGTPWMR